MKKIIDLLRHPRRALSGLVHGNREAGMATAEYAVGTVAVIGLGGIIWRILTSPEIRDLIWNLMLWIVQGITKIGV